MMWWQCRIFSNRDGVLRPIFRQTFLSTMLCYSDWPGKKKGKATPLQERRMVDRFRVWAKGGEGGNGCWSYRRSRTDRHDAPDGGNGGKGGDVYLESSAALWDFSNLQHHLNAKKGGNGISKHMIGTRGSDKVALVPVGTVIHLVSGSQPTLMRNNSITSMDPWEIPVDAEDIPTSSKRNDHRYNEGKHSHLLNMGDITCSVDDIGKLASPKSIKCESNVLAEESYKPEKEDKDVQCGKRCSKKVLEEHGVDEWWKDDNEWWDDEKQSEEDKECQFELEETVQYSVAELTEPGQRILVARGGEGGLGNAALNKDVNHRRLMRQNSSSNTGTLDNDELFSLISGSLGSESILILELKSIADVGLVGMPNAGKSTLLGTISRANPAVGHYAFTTLRPNIGNLIYEDFFSVSVADIPGLIKGAHENRGLGHAFLRHIERTKVLAYVVDLAAALDGKKGIMPWEQLRDLILELEYHREGLTRRPSLVVANKIDEEGAVDIYEELKRRVRGVPIFPVCAVLGEGVQELKTGLRKLLEASETGSLELNSVIVD
ncbi:hypothetical protein KSP40_PGU020129 [Platanthera guangdongensis]|uniref:GTP-binding protein OBGM, mitochondrial n=1 Tax=Platanthera guangdongensis TaxID=2320717 RepID=A0ABR2MZT0_9ASPA